MSGNDLTGKRYGKLTALYPTEKKERTNRVWCLRCDCGNLVVRSTRKLNDHSACDICNPPYSRLRKDYTGQRFGRLVALECTNRHKGKELVWRFQCDCGNIVELGVSKFVGGTTKSCGCLKRETAAKNNPNAEDLTGRTFGELTVVSLVPERNKGGRIWLCRCSCGSEISVSTQALTEGKKRSCGCVDARRFCVYKHVAPDGRVYIGITSQLPRRAWYQGSRYKNHAAFYQAIENYGGETSFRTAFTHYYLSVDGNWVEADGAEKFSETNLYTENDAEEMRRRYIREYNATDPEFGLNAASGGRKDFHYSYEARRRQSDTHTGRDGRTDWRVYIHENKINHKRYVGVTCRDPRTRWASGKGYRRPAKQGTAYSHFYNAIERYGWENFEHIIVAEGLTKAEAAKMEKDLIAEYDTRNPAKGYNITYGGDGTSGALHSEATKEKLSRISKERIEKTGVVNFKGQHHSEETKAKLHDLMVGRYDGDNNPFAGKHHSEETREKLSVMRSEPVNQYDMQGRFLRQFESAKAAAEATGISGSSLSSAVLGKTRFAGNYLWKKASEEFPPGENIDAGAILGSSNHTGQKRRISQYSLDGTFIREYESLKDAAAAVGAGVSNISAAAYGRTKSCRGFKWSFSDSNVSGNVSGDGSH